jgi:hypothetical protein
MEGMPRRGPALRLRRSIFIASTILVTACSAGPSSTTLPEPSSAAGIAELHFAALLDGDQAQARELIVPDPWCTRPDQEADFQQQIATLQGAQARDIHIQEEDVTGWLAYPPGTKAASISFEYRLNELEWQAAEIFVAMVDGGICDARFSTN